MMYYNNPYYVYQNRQYDIEMQPRYYDDDYNMESLMGEEKEEKSNS